MAHPPRSTDDQSRDNEPLPVPGALVGGISRWALLSCVVYLGVAFTFGEVFPFSTFSMYSDIGSRVPARKGPTPKGVFVPEIGPRAAIIIARSGGSYQRPESFERFQGVNPNALIAPEGWSSSMQYRVDEVRHWLETNLGDPGDEPGPIEVEVGFILIESTPTGLTPGEWHPVTRGLAWPKP